MLPLINLCIRVFARVKTFKYSCFVCTFFYNNDNYYYCNYFYSIIQFTAIARESNSIGVISMNP